MFIKTELKDWFLDRNLFVYMRFIFCLNSMLKMKKKI